MSSTIFRRWSLNAWTRWAVPVGATLLLVASLVVAGTRPKEEKGPAVRLSEAPSSVRSLRNPLAGDEKTVSAGCKLFQEHCAQCHGMNGRGIGHAANLRSPAIQNAPPGTLFWAVRNGRIRKGMPSWSQLPDQQLWQIITYLKTLKKDR